MTVAGLLLAAGAGRRFGGPKALVELGGELLVDRAVRVLRDGGCDPVVVVLGAQADRVVRAAALTDAVVLVNDGWTEGVGSSLRCGLRALAAHPVAHAVVLLVDQPDVPAAAVRRVREAVADAPAVMASYGGRPGHPVRLAAAVWDAVAAAALGEVGARGWLQAHPEQVRVVACDDLGNDDDIDTPTDLAAYLERQS